MADTHTMYAISATRGHAEQVPLFYLDPRTQGIPDEDAAERVARTILGPEPRIRVLRVKVQS